MVKKWKKVGQSPLSFELSQDYNLTMENRLPKKYGVTLKNGPLSLRKRTICTDKWTYVQKKKGVQKEKTTETKGIELERCSWTGQERGRVQKNFCLKQTMFFIKAPKK